MLGDDVARCSNGMATQKFREATPEERVVYRRWRRGTIVFYGALLLMSGVVAAVSYSSSDLMQLTKLSTRATAASPSSD